MKQGLQYMLKLKYHILVLLLVVAVMFFVLQSLYEKYQLAQQLYAQQQQEFEQVRQRFLSSDQEKAMLDENLPSYQQLIRNGFIGEERRINWVDNLRSINQKYKLFSIRYKIGKQEKFEPPYAVNLGNYSLLHSTMQIDLPMLHEMDMFNLLQELDVRQSEVFTIQQCEMVRLSQAFKNDLVPNLQASCLLDWITLHEPGYSNAN